MSTQVTPLLPLDARAVLLVRLRSIGDAVLTTVLAEAIRRERPSVITTFLLEPPASTLLAGHPAIDRVIEAGHSLGARLRALAEIRRGSFDLAVDLHGGPTAALFTALSRARLRAGLPHFRHRWAFDRLLVVPRPASPVHTVESNLAIARALGLEPSPGLRPTLALGVAARQEADRVLEEHGLGPGSAFVVVHPWGVMRSKAWPVERFAELARRLARRGHRVVVPAPPGAATPSRLAGDVVGLAPLTLPGLAALIARASAFVGNDGGPAHIAAALGVPAVAVFGSQDPRVWRPYPAGIAICKDLPCHPCAGYSCANPKPFECLDVIAVEEVEAAVVGLLPQARGS